MKFVSIEIKTSCEKCGLPVMVNGPLQAILCTSCHHEKKISAMTWKSMLEDSLEDCKSLKKGEGMQSQTIAGDFNRSLTITNEFPLCYSCSKKLKNIPENITETVSIICFQCKANNTVVPASQWLSQMIPEIILTVNSQTDEVDGEKDASTGKPVYFTCPACSGNLQVDGSSRLVTCKYCTADIYLPDDLWLRMHPVSTVKKWYIGYSDDAPSLKKKKLNSDLLEAAYDADDETGEELLSEGADPNVTDIDGRSALFLASATGAEKLVSLLLKKGAAINTVDNFGTSPLNIASYNGFTDIVKKLIKHGADVNSINNVGVTSLNAAAKTGQVAIVKLLLKEGADPEIANEDGKLPLDRARDEGHDEIVKLLKH